MDVMSPGVIRQVKKEIRVLGLSARRSTVDGRFHIFGVVYRGGLWLDGVMRGESLDQDLTESIIQMIKGSPHYKQIRVVMLSGNLAEDCMWADPARISTEVQRPLIVLAVNENQSSLLAQRGFALHSLVNKWGKVVSFHPIGLTSRESERILAVSTKTGSIPEALRVSELVADAYEKYAHQNV